MSIKKKGLGRGLDALLTDNRIDDNLSESSGVMMLRTADIEPNPEQARHVFERERLEELADSIKMYGVLQPIAVRPKSNGYYEIIAGERRWRACKIAGLSEIPVIIKDVDLQNAAELSLIENLQREDLNPVEEARGYKSLIENFGLTQEQAAERVGKSRTGVSNILRILKLPGSVLSLVESGALSYGHARTVLPLCDKMDDKQLLAEVNYIIDNSFSVREAEKRVKRLLEPKTTKPIINAVENNYYKRLENRISSSIGRRASISRKPNGSGKLTLSYSSTDDLEQLLKALCGNDIFDNATN